jgi:uncharacterized membrane protein HdeD (DUF308 family)
MNNTFRLLVQIGGAMFAVAGVGLLVYGVTSYPTRGAGWMLFLGWVGLMLCLLGAMTFKLWDD